MTKEELIQGAIEVATEDLAKVFAVVYEQGYKDAVAQEYECGYEDGFEACRRKVMEYVKERSE